MPREDVLAPGISLGLNLRFLICGIRKMSARRVGSWLLLLGLTGLAAIRLIAQPSTVTARAFDSGLSVDCRWIVPIHSANTLIRGTVPSPGGRAICARRAIVA